MICGLVELKKNKIPNIWWFQVLKFEDLLLFEVLRYRILNPLGFGKLVEHNKTFMDVKGRMLWFGCFIGEND